LSGLRGHVSCRSRASRREALFTDEVTTWLLVSAGLVAGRTLTSWPSLQDDLRNAGATWVDREVVSDGNWTSSRQPDDLPAFDAAFIAALRRAPARGAMAMPLAD
jgi:hypothetical protein